MKRLIFTAACLSFLFACTEKEQYEKISGEWECVRWVNLVSGDEKCDNNVYFMFDMEKDYVSKLGIAVDTGRYKIIDEILYVTPEGKSEFGVKITRLDQDTMVFLMNRAGEEEILTLHKTSN
jgi:hypothetical protein